MTMSTASYSQQETASASHAVSPAPANTASVRGVPPKRLARGPLWARLPTLRSLAPSGSQPQSPNDPQNTHTAPSTDTASTNAQLAFPDRVATTRVLLQDTQASLQKLSARMDAIASRNEQAVKEIQLSRAALESSTEKCVADVTDTSKYRHLASLCVKADSASA